LGAPRQGREDLAIPAAVWSVPFFSQHPDAAK
jgi:hypothetical protein